MDGCCVVAFSRADSSGTRIPATGKTTHFPHRTFSGAELLTPQAVRRLAHLQMEPERREGCVQRGAWRMPIEGPTWRVPHAAHHHGSLRAHADPSISICNIFPLTVSTSGMRHPFFAEKTRSTALSSMSVASGAQELASCLISVQG